MEENQSKSTEQPPESRFQVSRSTLLVDLWMGRIIRLGGISVVIAVFGMLIFLVSQIFPLFSKAKVESLTPVNFTEASNHRLPIERKAEA